MYPHFHSLITDGVFVENGQGEVVFHELPAPTEEEVAAVASETCRRSLGILRKRGLWQDDMECVEDHSEAADSALAALYQASVRGMISLGPRRGQRVVRFFGAAATSNVKTERSAYGFDLYARQAAAGGDRVGLERLARYILRPPLAQTRLERGPRGTVVLHMKRAWRDGTTEVAFEPADFMAKLAALVPRPRQNTLRFHGIYAPNARLRGQVVRSPEKAGRTPCSCGPQVPNPETSRLCWAELMARVFSENVLQCTRCGSSNVRRIAWITTPDAIASILDCLELSRDGPAPHPSRPAEELFGTSCAA